MSLKERYLKNPDLFLWRIAMPVGLRRVYKHLYRKSLNRRHAAILKTRSTKCNPGARVELHTLTGHDHLHMYLTMLKSFLRFHDDIAVVAHDGDNTITEDDKALLRRHIEGIEIFDKATADRAIQTTLAAFPRCLEYRSRIVNAAELLDFNVLARREKLVLVNSDVLFLETPRRLVDWIMSDSSEIIAVYEERPARQKEDLTTLNVDFPAHLTIALMCSYASLFDPAFVEEALSKTENDWFVGQNIYPMLVARQRASFSFDYFDRDRYQASGVFQAGAVFRHYWSSTGLFADTQFKDARSVINEL
jgi:hypothetical protein